MAKPTSHHRYYWLSSRILVALVYLFAAGLTMGLATHAAATAHSNTQSIQKRSQKNNPPNEQAIFDAEPSKTDNDERTSLSRRQQIIYMLLTAELAASRKEEAIALKYYLHAAALTQDPAIAEQATQMAINFQSPIEAILASELWAKADPNNLQAQLIAMTLTIGQSSERAMPYLLRAIDINSTQVDQYIMEIQSRLSDASALKLKDALTKIAAERPENAFVHLIAAQSAAQVGDIQNSNRLIDIALKLSPNLTHALQLKARLIRYGSETDKEALKFLAERVNQFPENAELRLFYANALMDNGNTAEAKLQLAQLIENKQYGGQALVALGEIAFKEDKLSYAISSLKKALEFPDSRDLAQYLLGQVFERQGNAEEAIRWYSDIQPGSYQISATLKAVDLLKKQKAYKEGIQLLHNASPTTIDEQKQIIMAEIELLNASKASEDALELVNEVLPKIPNDPDMLYLQAITANKLKKWDMAEQSLKKILKQNPNNANALNALGYALSFNHKRYQEALTYLNQAVALAPNNPYFMDSLGWVHFRAGDIQKAMTYLQKAATLSDDGEIAAHLGEVLWANNQKEDAKTVWKKALEKNADNSVILETLKRLEVNLNP